ncbi:GNAT family N-acetyltransferase [Frigoribacterium sp. ACAM 257]|uniref:GNAT family N-acetyltransferase n=1 Tax=Frigoribacterium sp. ACAM 257 TaxID=2508998 RepID=UPI00174DC8AC|nr:GNAT family N-acetyltransferase [Frigoribacterium sp. ACAM 257]
MQPFVLESSAVRLEVPGAADVEAIVEACQDPVLQRFTTVPRPYAPADARFFLERIVDHGWATGREATWGLRGPGSSLLLGVVSVRMRTRDIGFWTTPAARGRGLMTAAVRLVADWALGDGGLDQLHWEGYVGNDASAAVARRTGFTYTGVGPGTQPDRDGGRPLCWKARLRPVDERFPKQGWPDLTGGAGEPPREWLRPADVDDSAPETPGTPRRPEDS